MRPPTCPWRAFKDPVVLDVLDAYTWDESGQLSMWLTPDPPNHIIEGLHVFRMALRRAREDLLDEQAREAEKKRKRK